MTISAVHVEKHPIIIPIKLKELIHLLLGLVHAVALVIEAPDGVLELVELIYVVEVFHAGA